MIISVATGGTSEETTDRVIRVALRYLVGAIGVLAVAGYVWVYARPLAGPPIRSDGVSYYVYLPAWLIDADPTFDTQARACCGGPIADPIGIHRWPETGRWIDVHPIGVALLVLPFFLIAHALSWWSNLPRDGFSFYYQHLAGLAGLAYFLAGLALLRRLLMRHFSDGVVLATLVSLTFATNLFHYGVYDSSYSHSYSFFLITTLLWLTERWWTDPTWRVSLALGAVAALMTMTRHTNAMFLMVVPLYGVTGPHELIANVQHLWDRRGKLGAMAATAALCVTPQLAVYKLATGHWLVSSYAADTVGGFTFASPHLAGVLFSLQKGLFFWSPVLALAVAGLFVARGWARGLVLATTIVMALDTYVIASWWDWKFGGSYGHRAFVDSYGVLAIFLAAFFEWTAERPRLAEAVGVLTAGMIALSAIQMTQYWFGIMPSDNITWAQYRAVFLRFP